MKITRIYNGTPLYRMVWWDKDGHTVYGGWIEGPESIVDGKAPHEISYALNESIVTNGSQLSYGSHVMDTSVVSGSIVSGSIISGRSFVSASTIRGCRVDDTIIIRSHITNTNITEKNISGKILIGKG
jgi:hypothetical protein